MLRHLPRSGVVAELGTMRGDFARLIASETSPRELHLVDRDFSEFDPSGLDAAQRHEGQTVAVVEGFPRDHFDWIYVDADHSYSGVRRDIEVSAQRVKPGGFLVFNDFAHIDPYLGRYGVHRAVTEFVAGAQWPVRLFAYEPAGLYDIAIQRPTV